MTRLLGAVVVFFLALLPRYSHAWCAGGTTWNVSSSRVIPVYLSLYTSEGIQYLIDPSWGATVYTLERA